jgi:hypothetical protein
MLIDPAWHRYHEVIQYQTWRGSRGARHHFSEQGKGKACRKRTGNRPKSSSPEKLHLSFDLDQWPMTEQRNNEKAYLRFSINIRHLEPNDSASSPDIFVPAPQPISKHYIPHQWPLRSFPVH